MTSRCDGRVTALISLLLLLLVLLPVYQLLARVADRNYPRGSHNRRRRCTLWPLMKALGRRSRRRRCRCIGRDQQCSAHSTACHEQRARLIHCPSAAMNKSTYPRGLERAARERASSTLSPALRRSDTIYRFARLRRSVRAEATRDGARSRLPPVYVHIGNWLPRSGLSETGHIDRHPELPVTRDSPSRADDDRSAAVDPSRVHGTCTHRSP